MCSIQFSCCVHETRAYFTIKQIKDSFSSKKVTWALWDEILSVRFHHEILSAVAWLHGASICCKRMGFSAFHRHLGIIYITELYIYDHYNDTWDFVPKPVIPIHENCDLLTFWHFGAPPCSQFEIHMSVHQHTSGEVLRVFNDKPKFI